MALLYVAEKIMNWKTMKAIFMLVALFTFALPLNAQEIGPGGMPPAKVVVSDVKTGMVAEKYEFIGTVYYVEVSDVASEVNGKVERVSFEEGERVRKGDILVGLNAELLEKQHNREFDQARLCIRAAI
jgi:multidrug efflux pump subunit AcrA (membrane-fusion protein)